MSELRTCTSKVVHLTASAAWRVLAKSPYRKIGVRTAIGGTSGPRTHRRSHRDEHLVAWILDRVDVRSGVTCRAGDDQRGAEMKNLDTSHIAKRIAAVGRPPVLDDRTHDASQYWSDPPVETDWQAIAVRHSRTVADQLAVMVELREHVSSVSMDATIWKVLALIGWSVAVLAAVWP